MISLLSERDFQGILTFLQGLYALTSFENFSDYTYQCVPHLVSADIPVFTTVDFRNRSLIGGKPVLSVPDMEGILDPLFDENPVANNFLRTLDFSASKASDFITEQELHQLEFYYHRFMRCIGAEDALTIFFPRATSSGESRSGGNTPVVADSINLFRDKRSFTERDRTVLNILLPHLMQARKTAQLFDQVQQSSQQLVNSLSSTGMIILSREGHIQLMTEQAKQWLNSYFPSKEMGQSLPELLHQWVKYQWDLLTKGRNITKPLLPLRVEQNGKQLSIRLSADPTSNQGLLLFEEEQQSKLSLSSLELLGLSKREAEVLLWVAKGKENAEIAEFLCVSALTVKKHLEKIYQKLGVSNRASAVIEVLNRLGLLNFE